MLHAASTHKSSRAQTKKHPASFEDILVHLDESPSAANALAYAEALLPDGNTTALMFGLLADYPMSYSSEVPMDAWLLVQERAKQTANEIEGRLKQKLARADSRAELRRSDVMSGEAGEVIAVQGRYNDLTIIGWPAGAGSSFSKNLFEAALFQSGRPVLLVPESFTRHGCPKRVLIAWSPERESARAVNDALPLLQSAEEVRILVVDTGSGGPEVNPGGDMARHLARHGVKVEVKHVPGSGEPVQRVILKEGEYLGADLIVMGGYGHSRTGEWLFGGVTRDILRTMDVPILMSH